MLLSALLLATVVQATPTPPALGDQIFSGRTRFHPLTLQAFESFEPVKAPEGCPRPGVELAVNAAPTTQAKIRKLGDLPPANHTLTVLRSVDGCPVSSTVRYNVDRPAGR